MKPLIVRGDPNDEQKVVVEDVVEVAQAWQRGELPVIETFKLCSGRDLFTAVRFSSERVLLALLDARIDTAGAFVRTKQGFFAQDVLNAAGALVTRDAKGVRISWPDGYNRISGAPHYKDGSGAKLEGRQRESQHQDY